MTGRPAPKGLQINDYVAVIQSVIEGQGNRARLGSPDRRAGRKKGVLLRLTDHHLATGKNFPCRPGRATSRLSPAAMKVRDWMTDPRNR